MPVWKIVHIIVRWALLVVAEHEAESSHLRLPVLSQLQLGRFMSRSDASTCLDIAMDILKSSPERDRFSEDDLVRTMRSVRESAYTSLPSRSSGYSRSTDSVVVARRVLAAVERQLRMQHQLAAFMACCRTTTFAAATRLLPGRDWQSVRDDFRRDALLLWEAESVEMAAAADQMSRALERLRRSG